MGDEKASASDHWQSEQFEKQLIEDFKQLEESALYGATGSDDYVTHETDGWHPNLPDDRLRPDPEESSEPEDKRKQWWESGLTLSSNQDTSGTLRAVGSSEPT